MANNKNKTKTKTKTKSKIKNQEPGKGHSKIRVEHNSYTPFSSNNMHPAFCFRYIQSDYSLEKCDKEVRAACAQRLENLGKVTWGELQNNHRHGLGHEKIAQNSINEKLPPNTPGDRNFLSFRLGGGKKSVMIGYRKDKVFYIVWIDPHGQVYKHG